MIVAFFLVVFEKQAAGHGREAVVEGWATHLDASKGDSSGIQDEEQAGDTRAERGCWSR